MDKGRKNIPRRGESRHKGRETRQVCALRDRKCYNVAGELRAFVEVKTKESENTNISELQPYLTAH